MVGYHKNDSLTAYQKLLASCFSGVVTRFITQPMDVVKVKTQLLKQQSTTNNAHDHMYSLFLKILKEEGITAFWHGHNLGQVHSVLSVSTQFYVYEMLTEYVTNHHRKIYKPVATFLCGFTSGCIGAALVSPLEVIRVRQIIVKDQYGGLIRGAKQVYASGGLMAFYEGLTASILQMGIQSGLAFTVFSYVQSWILHTLSSKCVGDECHHAQGNVYQPEYILVSSTIAASAAGFISKSLTYPFDLTKRRLQIASHREDSGFKTPSTSQDLIKCSNLFQCLANSLKHDGFRGLYRGYTVTMYKSQVTSIVAFTTYELTCYAIREFEQS